MQQVKKLLLKGVVTPNPRMEMLLDIQRLLKEHHKQGGGVVLIMDSNEDWEKERQIELA